MEVGLRAALGPDTRRAGQTRTYVEAHMRPIGLTLAASLLASSAFAQVPVTPPADANLDAHLAAWEKAMAGVTNFRTDFEVTRTEATFGKRTELTGSVLYLKPGMVRLRFEEKANR